MACQLADRNPVTYFLYFVVNSCGTPLVYYLGIEENRRQAQDYFRTKSIVIYSNKIYFNTLCLL